MAVLSEIDTGKNILYAGSNPLRHEFMEYVIGDQAPVIALGGGIELQALHPLAVAKGKIEFAKKQRGNPDDCYVAFDALTAVPTVGDHGTVYKILGKPKDDETIQRMFGRMNNHDPLPYRIRAASALTCGDVQKTAWHDASILLHPRSLSLLAGDSGFATYAEYISMFGYQFGQAHHPTDFAAGLNLEALLAMGCVAAINDIPVNQQQFEAEAQRALFLATVSVSHKVLEPITHHDPMRHIISFPHHLDRLALLKKYSGAI